MRLAQGQTQAQFKAAALPWVRLMLQTRADQFGQLPANSQTDTQATVLAAHRTINLEETLI
ncbi:hypothetical protein D3C72_1929010 [compost metagenome]